MDDWISRTYLSPSINEHTVNDYGYNQETLVDETVAMSASIKSQDISPVSQEPVSPIDMIESRGQPLAPDSPPSKRAVSSGSLKSPRTARFAESTTVESPITGPNEKGRPPFADSSSISEKRHDVSDVGFGYVNQNDPSRLMAHPPLTPASPLKSALKPPGTPGKLNPLSPTFREELALEKREKLTEKENERDLKIKTRVRLVKVMLRFVNFSCSLIILSLVATTFTIFNTTKAIPARNSLPPWAIGTNPWPQILLLVLACVSLVTCLVVFWGYYKGGHNRAENVGVYYTLFSVGFFMFTVIMWIVGASLLQSSKGSNGGSDLWSWSCKSNTRSEIFGQDINYSLVCRLQDWSLMCAIIEIVIEVFVITIYAVVFYRFYSKRRLMRTMELRDRARSDLYLAQLRIQSAPNTPGFTRTPKSPLANLAQMQDVYSAAENGENYAVQYATPKSPNQVQQHPFCLQPPPVRVTYATPKVEQEGFANPSEMVGHHVSAAPGEKTYEAVPIPGAYSSPVANPSFPLSSPGFSPMTSPSFPPPTAAVLAQAADLDRR